MLVRFTTMCMAGWLVLDWNKMPKENFTVVVGVAIVLTIIDVLIERIDW